MPPQTESNANVAEKVDNSNGGHQAAAVAGTATVVVAGILMAHKRNKRKSDDIITDQKGINQFGRKSQVPKLGTLDQKTAAGTQHPTSVKKKPRGLKNEGKKKPETDDAAAMQTKDKQTILELNRRLQKMEKDLEAAKSDKVQKLKKQKDAHEKEINDLKDLNEKAVKISEDAVSMMRNMADYMEGQEYLITRGEAKVDFELRIVDSICERFPHAKANRPWDPINERRSGSIFQGYLAKNENFHDDQGSGRGIGPMIIPAVKHQMKNQNATRIEQAHAVRNKHVDKAVDDVSKGLRTAVQNQRRKYEPYRYDNRSYRKQYYAEYVAAEEHVRKAVEETKSHLKTNHRFIRAPALETLKAEKGVDMEAMAARLDQIKHDPRRW